LTAGQRHGCGCNGAWQRIVQLLYLRGYETLSPTVTASRHPLLTCDFSPPLKRACSAFAGCQRCKTMVVER